MEYLLLGIAGIAVFFLVIFLRSIRRQEKKLKKNLREIKKMKTEVDKSLNIFE